MSSNKNYLKIVTPSTNSGQALSEAKGLHSFKFLAFNLLQLDLSLLFIHLLNFPLSS